MTDLRLLTDDHAALRPAVDALRRAADAVADLDAELAGVDQVSADLATRIRRDFYGLYALLINHFDKERLIYHPFLEGGCSPRRLAALFGALDTEAAKRALAATS
ncbi:MAG: hypothetical protein JF603_15520 [Acidobacteria bacterium]|nr:hypothetical protein [Acidobacteriota bacterium]